MLFSTSKRSLFALDLGTSKFCIARYTPPEYLPDGNKKSSAVNPIQIVDVPARGMKRGMLSDFKEATHALNELISKAEESFQVDIDRVVTGIAGSHLHGERLCTTIPLQIAKPIDEEVQTKLTSLCEIECYRQGKEILHIVPVSYRIDNREKISSPLGFCGSMLKGEFLVIYADATYVRDVVRLCNQSGLKVQNIFAEPFASASVSLSDEAKQIGCVVADIGGGTTDGIVFQGGKPCDIFTVNIAGFNFTNDISAVLGISRKEAEVLKENFKPNASPLEVIKAEHISGSFIEVSQNQIEEIIDSRLKELSYTLAKVLIKYKGSLPSGLYLTGGGSGLQNIADKMKSLLKIHAQCIQPYFDVSMSGSLFSPDLTEIIETKNNGFYSPKYATVVGLINLETMIHKNAHGKKGFASRFMTSFMNWLKEMS